MVLRRDQGERIGLVAVALEVRGSDLAEHAGKAARRFPVLRQIGGFEEIARDLGVRRVGHLLDANYKGDLGPLRFHGLDGFAHRRRAGRTGVLDAGRRLEPKGVVRLEHDRGGEVLLSEAGVEVAE